MIIWIVLTTLLLLGSSWTGVPLSEFYPFGARNGDTFLPKGLYQAGYPIQLTTPFPFFNDTHGEVYLRANGLISFRKGDPWYRYRPTCEPVDRDLAYIGPYVVDVNKEYVGNISFRATTDRLVLQKAERDIWAGFRTSSSPSLVSAFIVTWDRVPRPGARESDCSDFRATETLNTFQAVLVTDGLMSWAIFYYNTLSWTTAVLADEGCSLFAIFPAKAGYDAGDGLTFQHLPGSCTDDVHELACTSNMGFDGKWIMRTTNPDLGSCIRFYSEKLTISPASVIQDSKSTIKLSVPCLKPSEITNINCEILDHPPVNVSSWVDLETGPTVFCLLPPIRSLGKLQVNLRVAGHLFTGYLDVASLECPPLVGIPNGQVKALGRRVFELAHFSCDPGYVLQGKDAMVCGNTEGNNNPAWLGNVPTCSVVPPPECPSLSSITNGDVKLSGRLVSDLARFSCNRGHVLVGSSELICGARGEGNLTWLGTLPTCSPLPTPETVICDEPANVCLEPDFPDGSCVTYVSLGCWVQLYCDEWITGTSLRIRNGLQETITWKYEHEEKLLASTSGLVGQNPAGGALLLENLTLTATGSYQCQREYAYTNSSTHHPIRSPPTVHRIHVVPVGPLSAADRLLFRKVAALREEVLHLLKTSIRLNSTLVSKCQELLPIEPVQLIETLSQEETPTVGLTAAPHLNEVTDMIQVLHEGVAQFQSIVHKLGWSLRQCRMMRQYRKGLQGHSHA